MSQNPLTGVISFAALPESNASNNTAGGNVLVQVVTGEAANLDHVLWFIGRVIEAAILAVIILVVVVMVKYRHFILTALRPQLKSGKDSCRCRKLRRCLNHLLCCGCCSPGGFQELGPADVLVVTLVCASDLPSSITFYLKTWTEPIDGPQKLSRVHRDVGHTCDLGDERLHLDWYGDEDALIVQALTPTGIPGGPKDRVLAETRISQQAILRYADLSKQSRDGSEEAVRLFPLSASEGRASGDGEATVDPVAAMVVKQVQTSVGIEPVDPVEVEQLREENRLLKSELSKVSQRAAESFRNDSDLSNHTKKVVMQVALKFEIQEINRRPVDASMYRSHSRDVERAVHAP